MSFIEQIKSVAKANKKTIVLPEVSDMRTLEAAHIVLQEGFADIILVGSEQEIRAKIAESGKNFVVRRYLFLFLHLVFPGTSACGV